MHLKGLLLTLTRGVLGQPECYVRYEEGMFAPDGSIPSERTRKFLSGFVDRFVTFVAALAAK